MAAAVTLAVALGPLPVAAAAYRGAGIGAVSELVSSGSPTVFAERLTTLDHLAHHTHGRITALLDATARPPESAHGRK